MNNLHNAYTLSQDLKESTNKLETHQNDLRGIKRSQDIFTASTYFIYFSFTSVIFAGVTVWNLQDYIFGNYTNVIGMIWALVTVFMVPLALSLAKHFNYKAIAKYSVEHDRNRLIAHSIIALALFSGLYYEAISSSSNLQAKAFHAVENSKAGDAILNTTVSSQSSGLIASQLADAEFKLVACQRKLKAGDVKDCDNSMAKVNSLKQQAQAERESVATANVAAITAKQEALSNERDEHALPAAKYVAEIAGRSNDYGTMIVVIIAAAFFELIHISTIFNEARALRGIDTHTGLLKTLNADYFRATGKTFDADDFKDSRTIDLSDKPLNVPMDNGGADFEVRTKGKPYQGNDGFGFVPAPKTASRFKWQENGTDYPAAQPRFTGFVDTNRLNDPAQVRESGGFRQSPEQLARARDLAADDTGSTYRQELRNGSSQFKDVPLDRPASPAKNQQGQTEQLGIPSVQTTQPALGIPSLDDSLKVLADDLYPAWLAAVKAGEITSAKDPSQKFIWKATANQGEGKQVLSAPETARIWETWQERAAGDGVLKPNPKYQTGNRQPKYILS